MGVFIILLSQDQPVLTFSPFFKKNNLIFFSFILHVGHSFPSLLSSYFFPLSFLPLHPPPSTSPLFVFRKGHSSQGCQQNMVYQIEVGLISSPCIKVGLGNPVWGVSSQKSVQMLLSNSWLVASFS